MDIDREVCCLVHKLGIVGVGRWGSIIAQRIREAGVAEISVIYDLDPSRASSLASLTGARVAKDLGDFDRSRDLVGVIIATSIESLASAAQVLIEMGHNVLIEKPVADSLEKARLLRELAERRGVIAMPGFIVRFDPVSMWVKNYIEKEKESLGDLYLYRLNRRPPHARSSSILLDLSIHDIDLARFFIGGDITPISWYIHNLEVDEGLTLYARHDNGVVYIHTDGFSRYKVRKAIAMFDKSYVEADYIYRYIIHKKEGEKDYIYRSVRGVEALTNEITAFINKCLGKEVDIPTLRDAEKAHEVIAAIISKTVVSDVTHKRL